MECKNNDIRRTDVTSSGRYHICAPFILLNVQFYIGAWAWNVKIITDVVPPLLIPVY